MRRRHQVATLALVLALSALTAVAEPASALLRSGTVRMDGTGGNKTQVLFDVPVGKTFVLTDLYFHSCNSCLAEAIYLNDSTTTRWQTFNFVQGDTVDQHWTTGIVFASGTQVILETQYATNGWHAINWAGYFIEDHPSGSTTKD